MSEPDHLHASRRTVLAGIAGLGLLPTLPEGAIAAVEEYGGPHADHADSYHPGPPRFTEVGERIHNPVHVGEHGAFGARDNLAPRLPTFDPNLDTFEAGAFEWSLLDRPAGSEAELTHATSVTDEAPRYDSGRGNTAEFEADVPGRYRLQLEAPDGTHEWTIHAFPAAEGPRPRLDLDATIDGSAEEFVLEAEVELSPTSGAALSDVEVVFLADDRDRLSTADLELEPGTGETTARVPIEALDGEIGRVHAACYDGNARSMMDTVGLAPDGDVDLPNRPPEWAKDGVMYQIFLRSWAGDRGETTFDELIDGLEYLDELGIDWLWLTPTVPAESTQRQFGGDLLPEEYDHLLDTLSGGGPHGYDTLDYFGVAPDLVPEGEDPIESYRRFVDACHDRDIRVVFDLVASHSGRSHPYFQATIADQGTDPPHPDLEYPPVAAWEEDSNYFDWYDRVADEDVYRSEFVEAEPYSTGFFGLRHMPNFNYDTLAARAFMLAVADFWSGEIGVDGFRCDVAWGVPISLWKEIREVVRTNDGEFLMLDETIPYDPRMAENAFDMHYDTLGFTNTTHDVASGTASPEQLVDAIEARIDAGVPNHSLVLNLTENHDEHRLLNQAVIDLADPDHDNVSDEEWERAAHLQRACWATGVCLPGVPGIYYGQERQISRFGEGRHMGEEDHRGRTAAGIDTGADVRPGGRQRAFMNWDEYPPDHLQFYTDLVEAYHELDALKPDADLRNAWHFSQGEVLSFGRDATALADVSGPDRVLVLVNFEAGPVEVAVREAMGRKDLLSGDPIEDSHEDWSGLWFDVDDVVVLEAPDFFASGHRIASFDPPEGTDYGPGEYEYPTGEEYPEGVFDASRFSVHDTGDAYQFHVGVEGDLENPWELPGGMSHPHLQVYVRDPDRDDGSMETREGVNATFEDPYQYRVLADGENGVRVEGHEGNRVGDGELSVNPIENEFVVTVSKADLAVPLRESALSPLLMGYDGAAPGGVRRVEAEADEDVFGGAVAETAPNVIDLALPGTFPNETALAYDIDDRAVLPFAAVITEFEPVASFDLETGLGYGPGEYELPTGGDYYEAAWDLEAVSIEESRDDVRIEYTLAADPENPWGFDPGFSHQFFQLYLHVPHSDGPATRQGREGTNVAFESPYHYRVVVHGEGTTQVEDADGSIVTGDVDVALDGRTVAIEFPRNVVEWETEESGVGVAATVMPYDGFGEGGLRPIAPDPDEHVIGGGAGHGNDPAVMDAVVPDDVDRREVLADYDADEPAELPLVFLGEIDTDAIEDPVDEGDDEAADEEHVEDDSEVDETDETDEAEETDDAEPQDPADPDADDGLPGFGVLSGLAGTASAAYAGKRITDRSDDRTEDD